MIIVHALAAVYILTVLGVAGAVVWHVRYERRIEARRKREDAEVAALDELWELV